MKNSFVIAFLSIVVAPFGLFCLAYVFIFLGRADFLSAMVALGAAVFALGFVAMLATVFSGKVTPRVERDEAGLLIRPDRKVDTLLMVSTCGGFLAMALYAVLTPLDLLAIRAPRGNDQYFVIFCAIATLVGVFSLRQIVRQRGTSTVRVTGGGLVSGNTITFVKRTWDEVTDIDDRPTPGRQPNGATYIRTADGHTRELPSSWYTPGGRTLHAWLRFYWQHPESRDELTDDRAVRRLEARV